MNSYVLAYGSLTAEQIEDIKKFDVAIVGPEITGAQLKNLQSTGVLVFCYAPTTADDITWPYFTGFQEQDYLWSNRQKVTNSDGSPDYIMDPGSVHFRQVVVSTIQNKVFARGFDGVFLDTVQEAYYYKSTTDILMSTAELLKEIRDAGQGKLLVQNNGWRDHILYTAPYIDFLMWEDYPYDLGTSDTWLNRKRNNLISLRDQYKFKVITLKTFNVNNYSGLQSYYSNSRSYGFIPYGCLNYITINTYDVPARNLAKST